MKSDAGTARRRKALSEAALALAQETAQRLDPDPAHSERVAALALALFDGLRTLHRLGPAERFLLHLAARLHDIGWSGVVSGKHHKMSCRLILNLDLPGLEETERLLCALIARYHTKALPRADRHRRFASLDSARRELIEWLSGILRVADGLDCDHSGKVRSLGAEVGPKAITLQLQAMGSCREAVEGARKKEDLLVQKAGRILQYRW
jgi:exopolyphosphatase/guanosine-5'-triphosphate,3'-diphosphate pyrophosphatase